MTEPRTPAAEYLRFLAWATVVAALVALLGYLPTRRLAGEGALPSMLAGCALALLASAAGGIPVARSRRATTAAAPAARLQAMLAAMGLRFAVLLALGGLAGSSGWFESSPLLIWIAIGYLALLAVDTWYAVKGF
jgi:hypothetical protein